jgi:hypothetical protein
MKILANTLTIVGTVLAYASEFGVFLFGVYKYTQGYHLWTCVLWGILADVILRVVAFSSLAISGILVPDRRSNADW